MPSGERWISASERFREIMAETRSDMPLPRDDASVMRRGLERTSIGFCWDWPCTAERTCAAD